MKSDNQVPIMTNHDSILQFGNNAYGKPATALNILRETIMGRGLFILLLKSTHNAGSLNAQHPLTFSVQWKTLQLLI